MYSTLFGGWEGARAPEGVRLFRSNSRRGRSRTSEGRTLSAGLDSRTKTNSTGAGNNGNSGHCKLGGGVARQKGRRAGGDPKRRLQRLPSPAVLCPNAGRWGRRRESKRQLGLPRRRGDAKKDWRANS